MQTVDDARSPEPRAASRLGFRAFLVATTGLGFAVTVVSLRHVGWGDWTRLGLAGAVIVGLLLIGELRPLVTAGAVDPNGIPVSTAFVFALMLRWGVGPAIVAQATGYILADIVKRRQAWRTIFNIAQQSLSFGAAWLVLAACGVAAHLDAPVAMDQRVLLAVVAAAPAYFLVNEVLVVRAVTLHDGSSLRAMLRAEGPYDALVTGSLLGLAPLVVIAAERGAAFVPLLLLPLGAVYRTASLSVQKEQQSQHDALTGLPNRKLLQARTVEALAEAARDGTSVALCLLDLDRFKEINDTLGHPAGDRLLAHVAQRLQSRLRDGDTVARLGGDEFVVLLTAVSGAAEAAEAAARVAAALDQPFTLDGVRVDVATSMGIALYPEHAGDHETLLQRADVAMYVAKQRHSGTHLYDAASDVSSVARLGLLGELRHALAGDELLLHYQPKVALPSGVVVGVEALVRWQHPTRGLLAPDEFLHLAEQSGLDRLLTSRVLALALAQTRAWYAEGLVLPVSVNISAADVLDPGFVDALCARLGEHGVAPAALVLEITERGVLDDAPVAAENLARLDALGVGLSLDDFGTGYSSLAHLVRVPVSEVKVDRSFVARLGNDALATTVVRSVVDLGHALGVRVVAEGVETAETWDALSAMGCDEAQGWVISRALPAPEATAWLRRHLSLNPWTKGRVDRRVK